MKELMIYEFQAKHIENTLRMVSNILGSQSKETCVDRQVCKAQEMIKEVLKWRNPESINETLERHGIDTTRECEHPNAYPVFPMGGRTSRGANMRMYCPACKETI